MNEQTDLDWSPLGREFWLEAKADGSPVTAADEAMPQVFCPFDDRKPEFKSAGTRT